MPTASTACTLKPMQVSAYVSVDLSVCFSSGACCQSSAFSLLDRSTGLAAAVATSAACCCCCSNSSLDSQDIMNSPFLAYT